MYCCKKITAILLLSAACLQAAGQNPQRNVYEFDFIKESNPWLTSFNAAGIGTLQVDRTSFVEAYYDKEDGGIIPVEGSDDSSLAGARTESFVRISDRIAFHGELSYSYFYGKNMGGHYLMDPSYNPVNFLENAEGNNGVKVKELYSLLGGISYSFSPKWSIGADVRYETGNYAKRKDPRPASTWMDLEVSAGVRFAPVENFSAGLNLGYARTMEQIQCGTFGTTDQLYYTLIDFGGYFGMIETVDADGAAVGSSSTPMINTFYKGALQLSFGTEDNILFFNEFAFSRRNGYYGERSSTSITYFEFGGNTFSYSGILNIRRSDDLHRVSLYGEYTGLTNYQNTYRKTTNPGKPTIVEYFGQTEARSQNDIRARLSYTGYLGIEQHRPTWEYGLDIDGAYNSFRATYYPFYRDQNVTSATAALHGRRNVTAGKNIFTVGLAADCFMGFGTKNSDGAYANSSSSSLRTNDAYLNRDFEYDTAMRIGGTLSFRYTRLFSDKISAYIDVRDTYRHTLEKPEYLIDGRRNAFTVAVGCAF